MAGGRRGSQTYSRQSHQKIIPWQPPSSFTNPALMVKISSRLRAASGGHCIRYSRRSSRYAAAADLGEPDAHLVRGAVCPGRPTTTATGYTSTASALAPPRRLDKVVDGGVGSRLGVKPSFHTSRGRFYISLTSLASSSSVMVAT